MPSTAKRLVIVESPAKAKTISGYLGPGYVVEASFGHVRDLPRNAADVPAKYKGESWARLGVDVDHGFNALYVVSSDRKQQIAKLTKLAKEVDEIFLATDEDREGEAIAWHLLETIKPKVPVKRMVFHEITKLAIQAAVANPREIDRALVDAQEARRILDRLYGYEVSPVLWKKVGRGTSAGRVQSVATRIVVEREKQRMAFRSANYWDISATLATLRAGAAGSGAGSDAAAEPRTFSATLVALDGDRVASGRDFDPATGATRGSVVHLDEQGARGLAARLHGQPFRVDRVEEKPYRRRPYAPFITSTLQQEGSRKLRFSSAQTMRVAQRLYENGYITYMRTDSVNLSEAAITAARTQIRELYGDASVPPQPRHYTSKVKNAQEAHEAIRPAGDTFRTPGEVAGELPTEEFRLYELIWRRTVASQMTDAVGSSVSVRIRAASTTGEECDFVATGKTITDPGFLRAYVESSDDEDAEADDAERRLPNLVKDQPLDPHALEAVGHTTQPPARYTEASLVKVMEELGIGRPSTYATIMGTIQDRGYVFKRGQALVPSFLAFAVVNLLERHFAQMVDYSFTAKMEDELDDVADGTAAAVDFLTGFYFGGELGDHRSVARSGGLKKLVTENLGDIDARGVNSIPLFTDDEGRQVVVRVGRYGPYLQRSLPGEADMNGNGASASGANGPSASTANGGSGGGAGSANGASARTANRNGASGDNGDNGDNGDDRDDRDRGGDNGDGGGDAAANRVSIPEGIAPDELTPEKVDELFLGGGGERKVGENPETGEPIMVKSGRFGPYISSGDRNASLLSTMSPETLSLGDALKLLTLPRVVGLDPDGQDIIASGGRYGPYIKRGADTRSLASEDQLFTLTLDEALALLAAPKQRGRAAAKPPLRDLGVDPLTDKPLVIKDGRFGPYVTDGESNASLRRGQSPETLTIEQASEMLSEKRAAAPKPRKTAAKKAPAKKTTAKKTASTARKTTAARKSSSVAKKTAGAAKKTTAKKAAPRKAAPRKS